MPMKISGSIEERFRSQEDHARAIKAKFSDAINHWSKARGWLFEDRIKQVESYAQKVEQSRIKVVDDVYAATIIVANKKEIINCCQQLEDPNNTIGIRVFRRQPKSFHETSNDPDRFNFDSVRMYFKPPIPLVGKPDYVDEIFEIQIKTLLEQAWDKATHASFYKSTDDLSWAKSRLISQTKALLESAELALIETDTLSASTILQKSNPKITKLNTFSSFFRNNWPAAALPKNIKRLSENTISFLDYIEKDILWLESLIQEENAQNRGINKVNLSPYWIVVEASIKKLTWVTFLDLLTQSDRFKWQKFPLIRELDLSEMNNIGKEDPVYILK
ncbi:MAG: hypothetical protein ACO1N8_09980 [Methylophilus sp.]